MGLSLGGVEFLEGAFPGIKGYMTGRMTKSCRDKLYIDDSGWGPEADSIEYGYRVPFGKIHVFIAKISELGPEPNICTDIVEPARRTQPCRAQASQKHAFVGFFPGVELVDNSACGGDTLVYLDDESLVGETKSIHPLYDGGLGGYSKDEITRDLLEPPHQVAVYMAGTVTTLDTTVIGTTAGADNKVPGSSGSNKTPM